jgi:hypothetical protein
MDQVQKCSNSEWRETIGQFFVLLTQWKVPWYLADMLDENQNRYGGCGEQKQQLTPPGFELYYPCNSQKHSLKFVCTFTEILTRTLESS